MVEANALYYYKARVYHPRIGRFMQTDPLGYKDGMNWYAYGGNDPMNRTDPSGTCGTRIEGRSSGTCTTIPGAGELDKMAAEQASEAAIAKIKAEEGYRGIAYPDGDHSSVGYGTQLDTVEELQAYYENGGFVSEPLADLMLRDHIRTQTEPRLREVKIPLTQGQYDVLVSYVYNVGSLGPKFLRYINSGDYYRAGWELDVSTQKGEFKRALWRRRTQEQMDWLRSTPSN